MLRLSDTEDEIVSIDYIGEQETLDINVSGNHLFYANGILTHNSAVDELEFDHSHISGGISKINTADNVFGIFTSRAMREKGRYQLQMMKTRNSAGVGKKIELKYDVETMRISDLETDEDAEPQERTINLQKVEPVKHYTDISQLANDEPPSRIIQGQATSRDLKSLLNKIKSQN